MTDTKINKPNENDETTTDRQTHTTKGKAKGEKVTTNFLWTDDVIDTVINVYQARDCMWNIWLSRYRRLQKSDEAKYVARKK